MSWRVAYTGMIRAIALWGAEVGVERREEMVSRTGEAAVPSSK